MVLPIVGRNRRLGRLGCLEQSVLFNQLELGIDPSELQLRAQGQTEFDSHTSLNLQRRCLPGPTQGRLEPQNRLVPFDDLLAIDLGKGDPAGTAR